ncbi:MAG TPA: hypothetical protein VGA13_00155 [Acidimicrobiales bacterium]
MRNGSDDGDEDLVAGWGEPADRRPTRPTWRTAAFVLGLAATSAVVLAASAPASWASGSGVLVVERAGGEQITVPVDVGATERVEVVAGGR